MATFPNVGGHFDLTRQSNIFRRRVGMFKKEMCADLFRYASTFRANAIAKITSFLSPHWLFVHTAENQGKDFDE